MFAQQVNAREGSSCKRLGVFRCDQIRHFYNRRLVVSNLAGRKIANCKLNNANLQLEMFILQFSISCSLSCNGETGARHLGTETCAKEKAVNPELLAAQRKPHAANKSPPFTAKVSGIGHKPSGCADR